MKKEQHFNKREVMSKIVPIVENIAAKNGLIPLEINFIKDSGRWFLRIFIFSMDHSIGLDDCEKITRGLNDYLDELIPVNYYLEVSSPGADRKLKSEKEYFIFKGKKAKIKLRKPIDDSEDRVVLAKLGEYQKGIGLKIELSETGEHVMLEDDNISSVKLCIE